MSPIPPRLVRLYLGSRRTRAAIVLLAIIGAALRASQPLTSGTGVFPQLTLMLVIVAAACVIGTATRNPFGETERTASSPLAILRLAHLIALTATAAAFVAIFAWSAAYGSTPTAILRNLAGFTGIALITATIFGAHVSWTLPLGYVMYCGGQLDIQATSLWSWPLLPAGDIMATAIAIGLLTMGIAAACIAGTIHLSFRIHTGEIARSFGKIKALSRTTTHYMIDKFRKVRGNFGRQQL
jgi:hypothetical protein